MIFPLTGLLGGTEARMRSSVFRNRACLSVLLVQHYLVLSVPPDWGT
jgi:hypothetical protein